MNDSKQDPKKPSAKQLRYLRNLAQSRGESFAYPRTSVEASAEIERLKARKRTTSADRRRELTEVRDDLAEHRGDAAAVRPAEIGGYGSSASWI
jgi:hypothetical protein